jgi:uncharacterized protein (DUF4213/DUF364 family)
LKNESSLTTLEQTLPGLKRLASEKELLDAEVSVLAKPLTPEEAIGQPGRRDFPIIIGKERVLEATVLGSKGHAFTDSPREFLGSLKDVLALELTSNQNRAIYVATLNAVMSHLRLADKTVHCKDEEPEECAREIAAHVLQRFGQVRVGLIGLNPAIAERLIDTFGADNVRITDLSPDTVGQMRFGVEVWDGSTRTDDLIDFVDVVIFTGTTLVNNTFDYIVNRVKTLGKKYIVYGVTTAGVSELLGFERICPKGRDGFVVQGPE